MHDAKDTSTVCAGVPATDGRIGLGRALAGRAGPGVDYGSPGRGGGPPSVFEAEGPNIQMTTLGAKARPANGSGIGRASQRPQGQHPVTLMCSEGSECWLRQSCQKPWDGARRSLRRSRSANISSPPSQSPYGRTGTSNASAPETCRSAPCVMMNFVRRRV